MKEMGAEGAVRAQTLGLSAPRFDDRGEMVIAGLNETYTFAERNNIPLQWQRFAPQIGKVPDEVGKVSYGVVWNYHPGRGFDYLAGVEVTSTDRLPVEFTHVWLAPQRYVVFEHQGHVSSIAKTIDTIWTQWIPSSGYTPVPVPAFERYTEAFNPQTGMGGMEIWVPIER